MENQAINAIKSFDSKSSQNFARKLRTDPELWNGANGTVSVSEVKKGVINGLVKEQATLLKDVKVIAIKDEQEVEVATDNEGIYSFELPTGTYDLIFKKEGFYDTPINGVPCLSDVTYTVNCELTKRKE